MVVLFRDTVNADLHHTRYDDSHYGTLQFNTSLNELNFYCLSQGSVRANTSAPILLQNSRSILWYTR